MKIHPTFLALPLLLFEQVTDTFDPTSSPPSGERLSFVSSDQLSLSFSEPESPPPPPGVSDLIWSISSSILDSEKARSTTTGFGDGVRSCRRNGLNFGTDSELLVERSGRCWGGGAGCCDPSPPKSSSNQDTSGLWWLSSSLKMESIEDI